MTGKQLKEMKKIARFDTLEYNICSCHSMIHSILIYHGKNNIMDNYYLQKHIDRLGLDIVQNLVNDDIEDFEKSKVFKNVYTDSEGCTYNSIQWWDDIL